MIKYKKNNGYKRKEYAVPDEQIIKDYKTMTQKQVAEKYGLKHNQIAAIMQRNGVRKGCKVAEEQEPPKPKATPPKGAMVRIKEGIAEVIASYPFHFTVKVNYGEAERDKTVNRWEFWEVINA